MRGEDRERERDGPVMKPESERELQRGKRHYGDLPMTAEEY